MEKGTKDKVVGLHDINLIQKEAKKKGTVKPKIYRDELIKVFREIRLLREDVSKICLIENNPNGYSMNSFGMALDFLSLMIRTERESASLIDRM